MLNLNSCARRTVSYVPLFFKYDALTHHWGRLAFSMAATTQPIIQKHDETPIHQESTSHRWDVVLYQYETCPFCNKVRAYLDYKKIPYSVVEVNPLTKKTLKQLTDYKKVPVITVDGKQVNDSSAIITELENLSRWKFGMDPLPLINYDQRYNVISQSGTSEDDILSEERKWRIWTDEVFVHTVAPNIYRTPSESLRSFDYMTKAGNFGPIERHVARLSGALFMYLISPRLKKRYGLKDDVRQSLYDSANLWMAAVNAKGDNYLGGVEPNLADLAVYGVIRSVEGLDTIYDLMANTDIEPWYSRLRDHIGESTRVVTR